MHDHVDLISRSHLHCDRTLKVQQEIATAHPSYPPLQHANPYIPITIAPPHPTPLSCRSAQCAAVALAACAGSMRGPRETVAKALALECMRAAKAQERGCYVFAFAGPQEVCLCLPFLPPPPHPTAERCALSSTAVCFLLCLLCMDHSPGAHACWLLIALGE